jgi:hypothetical protein
MAISRGHFSNFSAVLDRVGSISGIFGTHFSLFCRFFDSGRRYTRAEDGTLYYRSSQKGFKAPQLGP